MCCCDLLLGRLPQGIPPGCTPQGYPKGYSPGSTVFTGFHSLPSRSQAFPSLPQSSQAAARVNEARVNAVRHPCCLFTRAVFTRAAACEDCGRLRKACERLGRLWKPVKTVDPQGIPQGDPPGYPLGYPGGIPWGLAGWRSPGDTPREEGGGPPSENLHFLIFLLRNRP